MVHGAVGAEVGRDGGDDTFPVHGIVRGKFFTTDYTDFTDAGRKRGGPIVFKSFLFVCIK